MNAWHFLHCLFYRKNQGKDISFMKSHIKTGIVRMFCLTTAVVLLAGTFFAGGLKVSAEAEAADKYLSIGVYEDGAVKIEKNDEEIHEWGGSSALFVMLSFILPDAAVEKAGKTIYKTSATSPLPHTLSGPRRKGQAEYEVAGRPRP